MNAKLHKRIQRYGWDLAVDDYEPLWRDQLATAQARLLEYADIAPGERVLDIACGTGLVTLTAADATGPDGSVVGVDVSGQMVDAARQRAHARQLGNVRFRRMDAESLDLPDAHFDVALCALGLMYAPDPLRALREMRRVLRPGGRLVVAVWGRRSHCGWAPLFEIVDAEVASAVCPLFFQLGQPQALQQLLTDAQCETVAESRISTRLDYLDGDAACDAAFVGGPVAMAWSRFDDAVRARVRDRYLAAIEPWRVGDGYSLPGEFVVGAAVTPTVLARTQALPA